VASRQRGDGAADMVWKSLRTPNVQASAREASIAHARALLIYLKHRGVLNIDEFRRTNP
jgi:hypothetical protein